MAKLKELMVRKHPNTALSYIRGEVVYSLVAYLKLLYPVKTITPSGFKKHVYEYIATVAPNRKIKISGSIDYAEGRWHLINNSSTQVLEEEGLIDLELGDVVNEFKEATHENAYSRRPEQYGKGT